MKRIILLIVATLILSVITGCSHVSSHIGTTISSGEANETIDGETVSEGTTNGETVSEGTTNGGTVSEGTTNGETVSEGTTDDATLDDIWDTVPSTFYTLDDFRTFVKTNSRNLEDYSKDNPPRYLPYYDIEEADVIFIDELFSNEPEFLSSIGEIWVMDDATHYQYNFNTGVNVSVAANGEKRKSEINEMLIAARNKDSAYRYTTLAEAQNSKNDNKKDERDIIHFVDDYCLRYRFFYTKDGEIKNIVLNIYTTDYTISITPEPYGKEMTFESIISNPINAPVSVLFTDKEPRDSAVKDIIGILESANNK